MPENGPNPFLSTIKHPLMMPVDMRPNVKRFALLVQPRRAPNVPTWPVAFRTGFLINGRSCAGNARIRTVFGAEQVTAWLGTMTGASF